MASRLYRTCREVRDSHPTFPAFRRDTTACSDRRRGPAFLPGQGFDNGLRIPGGEPKERERRAVGSAPALLPVLQGRDVHADLERDLALRRAETRPNRLR